MRAGTAEPVETRVEAVWQEGVRLYPAYMKKQGGGTSMMEPEPWDIRQATDSGDMV